MTRDEFSNYDAAYVLGALSPQDRHAYEQHLRECPDCTDAVGKLAGMPGLLARVPLTDLLVDDADHEPPETLLPELVHRVNRLRRRRLRAAIAGAVLTTAAAVAAILVAFTPHSSTSPAPPRAASMQQLDQAFMSVSAQLVKRSWGTQIDLKCSYHTSKKYRPSDYTLVVFDKHGKAHEIASWKSVPGQVSTVNGSTALQKTAIARLDVRNSDGDPILRLTL